MNQQPELDALIVRNIGDIGAAANRAKLEIDARLWTEAGHRVAATAAEMGWKGHADAADEAVWLYHPDWLAAGDDADDAPFYLKLDERAEPGVEAEWTWLASFVGAWPGRSTMGMFVHDDRLTHGAWKKQLRSNPSLVEALVARGFRHDGSSGALYVPFLIDIEALAKAFEEDAFEAALNPLAEALATVSSGQSELTALSRLPAVND